MTSKSSYHEVTDVESRQFELLHLSLFKTVFHDTEKQFCIELYTNIHTVVLHVCVSTTCMCKYNYSHHDPLEMSLSTRQSIREEGKLGFFHCFEVLLKIHLFLQIYVAKHGPGQQLATGTLIQLAPIHRRKPHKNHALNLLYMHSIHLYLANSQREVPSLK